MGYTRCHVDWKKGKNCHFENHKEAETRDLGLFVLWPKQILIFFLSFVCPSWSSWEWRSDAAAEAILPAYLKRHHFLHEYIIPRSVLYLTGEVTEEDDHDYDKIVGKKMRKGEKKEMRKMIQTMTQRRIKTQPRESCCSSMLVVLGINYTGLPSASLERRNLHNLKSLF